MQLGGGFPQLQHRAEHRHLPGGHALGLEDVQGGTHALGVGVVAVDDQGQVADAPELRAQGAPSGRGQPPHGVLHRHAEELGDGEGQQRIGDPVAAHHGRRHPLAAPVEGVFAEDVDVGVAGAGVPVGPIAPSHDLEVRADPPGTIGQAGGLVAHHAVAAVGHVPQDLQLFLQHALQRAELLQVALAHGGDDRDVGAGDPGEGRDLAGLVGAQLEDHDLGVVGDGEEREGHPDAVVQVALGGVDPARRREGRRRHVLRGGLARRSGDGDDGRLQGLPAMCGETAEGHEGVVDGVQSGRRREAGGGVRHHGAQGATGEGVGHEVVAVEALADEGDVEVSLADRSGVGGDAGVLDALLGERRPEPQGAAHPLVGPHEVGHAAPDPASACRTMDASSKGCFSVPITW